MERPSEAHADVADNVWDEGRWKGVERVTLDFTTQYILEHVVRHVEPAGKTIAELGAGTGRLSYLLLKRGARKVTLLDNSRKALELSRLLFEDEAPGSHQIIDANVLSYAPSERYDVVMSSGLIEHFQGQQRFEIIKRHVDLAAEDCVIIHPSNRRYNRLFDRTPMAIRLYGFALTYAEGEINGYLEKMDRVRNVSHERFHFFYTVPLLHNRQCLARFCERTFLGHAWGGLAITHIEVA